MPKKRIVEITRADGTTEYWVERNRRPSFMTPNWKLDIIYDELDGSYNAIFNTYKEACDWAGIPQNNKMIVRKRVLIEC